jgi:hypothetical protein
LADIKLEKIEKLFSAQMETETEKKFIGSVQKISYDNLTREVLLKGKAQYS